MIDLPYSEQHADDLAGTSTVIHTSSLAVETLNRVEPRNEMSESCAQAVREWTQDANPSTLNPKVQENKNMKTIKNFIRNEEGMETIEYAVIAGLIAAVAVLIYGSGWGQAVQDKLEAAVNTPIGTPKL